MQWLSLNRRETSVILMLVAAFLAGTGISVIRSARRGRARAALKVTNVDSVRFARARLDSISGVPAAVPGVLIDINRADLSALEALPGIGPKLAQRIVEFRERNRGFRDVGELRKVSGIGPKRYAALRGLVTTGPYAADTGR